VELKSYKGGGAGRRGALKRLTVRTFAKKMIKFSDEVRGFSKLFQITTP